MATRSALPNHPLQSNPPPPCPLQNSSYTTGRALGSPGVTGATSQDVDASVPRIMTTITAAAAAEQPKSTGLSHQFSKRIPFLSRSKSKRAFPNQKPSNHYSRPSVDIAAPNYTSTPPWPSAALSSAATPAHSNQGASRTGMARLEKQKPAAMRSVTDPQPMRTEARTGEQQQQQRQQQAVMTWTPGSLLDVEIPDIKLERYSVMFSSLLENKQSAGGLLARRQATLTRLRAIDNEVRSEHLTDLQRHRRTATSPALTPAHPPLPELSGEVAPGPDITAPLRLRSNTFPMVVMEAEVLPAQEARGASQVVSSPPSMQSPDSLVSPRRDADGRPPLLRSKFHKQSVESIRSPYSRQSISIDQDTGTALSPPPPGGKTWRFPDNSNSNTTSNSNSASPGYSPPKPTTPPPPTTTTAPPSKQPEIPNRSASMWKRHHLAPAAAPAPKPHPKPMTREEALEDAAEVSIARQISISRQQRRLLEPLHEREMRRARANEHIKAASQISMDFGTKHGLAETKSSAPTIIHPEGQTTNSPPPSSSSSSSPSWSPASLSPYRRSERVTIEGA